VETLAADVTRPETLRGVPRFFEAVVYAVSADGFEPAAYRSAYVEGPARLMEALGVGGAGPRRFIFVSSTGVYAQNDGSWVDEGSPTRPMGFSGQTLLEGEQCVLDRAAEPVVLRLAGLYGPGRVLLVDQVRRGEASCCPDPPQYLNLIHRDDAAELIRLALALAEPPPLLLGVDDEPVDRCAILDWLSRRLRVPPPRRLPSDDGGPRRRANKRCSNARAKALGQKLRFPTWREGYERLLESTQ
jgi:nucleoside-diphosphate-sugar epimerase